MTGNSRAVSARIAAGLHILPGLVRQQGIWAVMGKIPHAPESRPAI